MAIKGHIYQAKTDPNKNSKRCPNLVFEAKQKLIDGLDKIATNLWWKTGKLALSLHFW